MNKEWELTPEEIHALFPLSEKELPQNTAWPLMKAIEIAAQRKLMEYLNNEKIITSVDPKANEPVKLAISVGLWETLCKELGVK